MTKEELRAIIIRILSDIAPDEDTSRLADDIPLRDQLEIDSMDFLEIALELKKRHRVDVPERDYAELRTIESSIAYLLPKMST